LLDTTHLNTLAISDVGFVFDPLTGHTFNVNETGLAVLRALKEGDAPEAIVARLRDAFDVDDAADVVRDVEDFLSRLREVSLVR
jgi:PqqD family protein of HPr-rel-A system